MSLGDDILRVLVSAEQIENIVRRLANEISKDYAGKRLVLIGNLKGAFMFISDLVRLLSLRVVVDFVQTSSYASDATESNGKVVLCKEPNFSVAGSNVLVVDDIFDTGATLNFLLEYFKGEAVASVEFCCLLNKPSRRKFPLKAKYLGTTIPDEFVVGYGLGYKEEYRNLPYVGVLRNEVWEN